MTDVGRAFSAGAIAAAMLLTYVALRIGRDLWRFKVVFLHGPVYPGSRVTNIIAMWIMFLGVQASVFCLVLTVIRALGRRRSGAMLAETKRHVGREMPGMEVTRS
jgi:hypothetical protein